MTNLIHNHPDNNVREAAIRLLDALCSWERNTGRHNLFIIKDSIGCEYRSLDGRPAPDDIDDISLLEEFDNLYQDELSENNK